MLIYPGGKRFAFSVFDDTDVATTNSLRPLYDCLYKLGIITTKSVWGIDYEGACNFEGSDTLENPVYAEYIKQLRQSGFEIGFHGATMESSERDKIEKAFENYRQTIGDSPTIFAAHARNRDNLYWGIDRFSSSITRWLYAKLSGDKPDYFQGHVSDSPYFWGDLAQQHLKYVRSFTFTNSNLLKLNFPVVYKRKDTPWVRNWFLSCDAENVEDFNVLIDSSAQEALEKQGGICIVSTHFGKGFVENDSVHPVAERLLNELSQRDAWFAPVSDLLDFYVEQFGCPELGKSQLARLEMKWFFNSFIRRFKRKQYKKTELAYLNEAKGK